MKIAASAMLLGAMFARADVTLLFEEPMGSFWSMQPAHTAVYFSRICAATPVELRRCSPGETGAVLSRYHRIDGDDWVAIPLVPYLYSVEQPGQAPSSVSPEEAARLREVYREQHLKEIAPDPLGTPHSRSKDWPQLVGEAFDRTVLGLTIRTSERQDDDLIQELNSHPNRNQFNIVFRNCANFAARIIDFYYPGAIGYGWTPGIMTPQHVARALLDFCRRHPETELSVFEVAQVAGTEPRSKPVHGIEASLASAPCTWTGVKLPTESCPRAARETHAASRALRRCSTCSSLNRAS